MFEVLVAQPISLLNFAAGIAPWGRKLGPGRFTISNSVLAGLSLHAEPSIGLDLFSSVVGLCFLFHGL